MEMLKKRIPTSWKSATRKTLRRIADRARGYGMINRGGKGIVNVIDIGSVERLPSPWYEHAARIRYLLMFEPRAGKHQNPGITALDVAVWSHDETRDFYIYAGNEGQGSSLLPQDVEYVRAHYDELKTRGPRHMAETWFDRAELARTVLVECRSLDSILAELEQGVRYHFLKVDVQGAEYQVLQGAADYLQRDCLGLHLELFTIPLYKDMVLLPEVEAYLAGQGFRLVKKLPPHGTFDSQHDCLFLREDVPAEDVAAMVAIRQVYGL
ncbi:MAG: FkbM family methyltransferase [Chloroflexota bacterium]